jgi:hypothetical protein
MKGDNVMNNKLFKKVLATVLAATLLAMPIVAGATDQEATSVVDETIKDAAPVSIGGTVITSDVAGAFQIPASSALVGVAVRQASATIKANLGMAGNEKPFVRAYAITAAKSPAVFASFNGAAAGLGGVVLGALNIDFGKMTAGKFSDLPAGASVPTTVGVKNANGRTLAVVKVLPGGATEILQDTDTNPNTVTFPITGGLAAYAVIAY